MSLFILLICIYSSLINAKEQKLKERISHSNFKDVHKNKQHDSDKDQFQIEVNLGHFNLQQDVTADYSSSFKSTIPSLQDSINCKDDCNCQRGYQCSNGKCISSCEKGFLWCGPSKPNKCCMNNCSGNGPYPCHYIMHVNDCLK